MIIALASSRGDHMAASMLAETWVDCPQVKATLDLLSKSAVPAGSTTDAVWAGPLAPYFAAEALTIMRGRMILGALEPKMQKVPLHVRLARETGSGVSGGWIAPGAATPVQKTDFASVINEHFKFGVIVPLTNEVLRVSDLAAEKTIRDAVLGGLGAALDNQFLLASVAGSVGVSPASIANGSTEITTTGTTSAQIAADLAAMLAAITTAGELTWIMRPKTLYRIALTLGSQAAGVPNFLFGIPVIASANAPAQITLVDASQILYADTGQFDVTTSEQSALQLDTAPDATPTASSVETSLWQGNLFAVKAMRWLAWLRPVSTSVSFMTVAY